MSEQEFDVFLYAYIQCAVWASGDDKMSDLHKGSFSELKKRFLKRSLQVLVVDAKKFCEENYELIKSDLSQAGHDFWLTQNHHGAGFWDGDWPEETGKMLTEKSHGYRERNLLVASKNKIDVYPQ